MWRALAFSATVLLASCAALPPPVYPPLRDRVERTPVVLVPGITGVELREAGGGRTVWGRGRNLLRPRDGGYRSILPIDGSDDGLEPGAVIEEIRLAGVVRKPVYGPIVALLEANGYRRGDLEEPSPAGDLFLFSYDWRRDNVTSARRLLERLERLRRARGVPELQVALICQSNGARLCRYLARYGGASLEEAEAGRAGPPEGIRVESILLVGTANGGSLRLLRELDRGRRYVPWVGRRFRPETLFSYVSLYEELPVYRADLFVDEAGEALSVDLFAAESWPRHGWSAFGKGARRRLARRRPPALGDEEERLAFLAGALARARRFAAVLERDLGVAAEGFPTRLYSIQNPSAPTPERALLAERRGGGRRLLFTGDRALRSRPRLATAITAPGDGHATVASQGWLSPRERAALACPPLAIDGDHFELILDRASLAAILRYLDGECP